MQDEEGPDLDDEAMFRITPAISAALRSATEASSSGRAATREALVTFKLRVLGLLDILARPSVAPGAYLHMAMPQLMHGRHSAETRLLDMLARPSVAPGAQLLPWAAGGNVCDCAHAWLALG